MKPFLIKFDTEHQGNVEAIINFLEGVGFNVSGLLPKKCVEINRLKTHNDPQDLPSIVFDWDTIEGSDNARDYARKYFNWHNVSFYEDIEPENILSFYRIRAALKAGFMVRDWSGQLIKKVLELDGLPIAIRSNKHLYEIFHKPFTVNELKWEDFINISTYYWDEETKSLQKKEKSEVEQTILPPTLPSLDEYPLEALLENIQNRFGNV